MGVLGKLYNRGWKYLIVGVATFVLDMIILFGLVWTTPAPNWLAVAIGFLVGVSINFYICYHWVYEGTGRQFHHGYFYFTSLALLGAFIISCGTTYIYDNFDTSLLLARIIMGGSTGVIGFFINTFFNFKLL